MKFSNIIRVYELNILGNRLICIEDEVFGVLYSSSDISKILKLKNIVVSIKRACNYKKSVFVLSSKDNPVAYNELLKIGISNKCRKLSFISVGTINKLLLSTNSILDLSIVIDNMKTSGIPIDVDNRILSRSEITFGVVLVDYVKEIGLNIIPQYKLGPYRIDFYIPACRLGVEYDEFGHMYYNKKEELDRELHISKNDITLIRVYDKDPIGISLANIHRAICKGLDLGCLHINKHLVI